MNGKGIIVVALLSLVLMGTTFVRAQAPREGIQVRGHWEIEVRNPDGSVAATRIFDNALSTTGEWLLAGVLGRSKIVGEWMVNLIGPDSMQGAGYTIREPRIGSPAGSPAPLAPSLDSETLEVSTQNLTALVMSGYILASSPRMIERVSTLNRECPAAGCNSPNRVNSGEFTRTTLPTPLPVQQGQIVQVKVTISFSSAPHPPGF